MGARGSTPRYHDDEHHPTPDPAKMTKTGDYRKQEPAATASIDFDIAIDASSVKENVARRQDASVTASRVAREISLVQFSGCVVILGAAFISLLLFLLPAHIFAFIATAITIIYAFFSWRVLRLLTITCVAPTQRLLYADVLECAILVILIPIFISKYLPLFKNSVPKGCGGSGSPDVVILVNGSERECANFVPLFFTTLSSFVLTFCVGVFNAYECNSLLARSRRMIQILSEDVDLIAPPSLKAGPHQASLPTAKSPRLPPHRQVTHNVTTTSSPPRSHSDIMAHQLKRMDLMGRLMTSPSDSSASAQQKMREFSHSDKEMGQIYKSSPPLSLRPPTPLPFQKRAS